MLTSFKLSDYSYHINLSELHFAKSSTFPIAFSLYLFSRSIVKVPNINFFIGLKPVNPEKKPFNITESVLMWGGSVLDRWKKNEPDATKYKMSELHIKLRKREYHFILLHFFHHSLS